MKRIIEKNKTRLNEIFRRHRVEKAYLFGSAARGNFNPKSDIDLYVEIMEGLEPAERGELLWSLYDELGRLFERKIDLVTDWSLKNPYFIEELEETKQLIYEQGRKKIVV